MTINLISCSDQKTLQSQLGLNAKRTKGDETSFRWVGTRYVTEKSFVSKIRPIFLQDELNPEQAVAK
jgi:hypothetical protein